MTPLRWFTASVLASILMSATWVALLLLARDEEPQGWRDTWRDMERVDSV